MISSALSSFLFSLGGVILVDLILSGDNALVIGAVAARISQRRQRWIALAFGGLIAILLRIIFTVSTTFLLGIPYLQSIGGVLVFLIAVRFVFEDQPSPTSETAEPQVSMEQELPALARLFSRWIVQRMEPRFATKRWNFLFAVATIAIADLTMSLVNIVAIGALAHGRVLIIVVGLVLSIVLLLLGSALISELVGRIPGLIALTSCILAWIASDLLWSDLKRFSPPVFNIGLHALLVGSIVLLCIVHWAFLRFSHKQALAAQSDSHPSISEVQSSPQNGEVVQNSRND